MRMWRNGRRSRLKICRFHDRVGSSPTIRTKIKNTLTNLSGYFLFSGADGVLLPKLQVLRSAPVGAKRMSTGHPAPHHPHIPVVQIQCGWGLEPTVQGLCSATVGPVPRSTGPCGPHHPQIPVVQIQCGWGLEPTVQGLCSATVGAKRMSTG